MFSLMSNLAVSILMSVSTLTNPTTPKALTFDASAYVTINNQIRVAVSKTVDVPVVVLLRNAENQVVFRQNIDKKKASYAIKLNVDELSDGNYELEVNQLKGAFADS